MLLPMLEPSERENYKQARRPRPAAQHQEGGAFASLAEVRSQAGLAAWGEAERAAARRFPVRWPRSYLKLARQADPSDPILRMGLPDWRELVSDPGDLQDPVGETRLGPTRYLIRKYRNRALLLVSARCHFYCRFCFRSSFPDGEHRDPTQAELDEALRALASDARIEEVILSGGDPLVLDDESLERLLLRLSQLPQLKRVRVHTRTPVVYPERVTARLARVLATGLPCRVVAHFNHPVELTAETPRVVSTLARHGIPLLNQAVLLRGVNDGPRLLADLCRGLGTNHITPRYLHHTDRTPGNAHFRVSIARGLSLYNELKRRLPETLLPRYVIDLPMAAARSRWSCWSREATTSGATPTPKTAG